MPVACNITVEGIPGSSEKSGRGGSSDVYEFDHRVYCPFNPTTGENASVRVHSPLRIVKLIDKASPGLHKALCTGRRIERVTLDLYRHDPDSWAEQKYFSIRLLSARVVDIRPYVPVCFLPENETLRHMEQVSFQYEEIQWDWLPDGITTTDAWRRPAAR